MQQLQANVSRRLAQKGRTPNESITTPDYDSRPMRRLALVVLALACAPTAAAAGDLTLSKRDFSPAYDRLRIQAALPKPERVGVQLATEQGTALGWIVEPSRRRFLTLRWDGRLNGARVPTAATWSG